MILLFHVHWNNKIIKIDLMVSQYTKPVSYVKGVDDFESNTKAIEYAKKYKYFEYIYILCGINCDIHSLTLLFLLQLNEKVKWTFDKNMLKMYNLVIWKIFEYLICWRSQISLKINSQIFSVT